MAVGDQAVFRCQHSTADNIRWRVNSYFVGRNHPEDIVPGIDQDSNNILVDTLTIRVREEYNGTEVVCVAQFDNGTPDEETQPAILSGNNDDCVDFTTRVELNYMYILGWQKSSRRQAFTDISVRNGHE